mgnify:CR=1 FL=1
MTPGVLSNPRSDRVQTVRALSRRAVRAKQGLFLADGPQSVREALTHRPDVVRDVYATSDALDRHRAVVESALAAGVPVHEVTGEVLAAMGDSRLSVAPQGLLAVCRPLDASLDDVLARAPRLLCVLTNVRDPGNAGTVLRGADAAGADAVVLSAGSVDVFGPKVVRSTAGSLFHLPVVVGLEIEDILERVRGAGLRLLAADGTAHHLLGDVDLVEPHAWVMGNEAWGLDERVRARCDDVVRVPIHGLAESLNLAMAATICLYASASAQRG